MAISVRGFERMGFCLSATCARDYSDSAASWAVLTNRVYVGGAFQVARCGVLSGAWRRVRLQQWSRLLADVVAALCARGENDQTREHCQFTLFSCTGFQVASFAF